MREEVLTNKIIFQEIKAIKMFIWLFYLVFFSYDILYYFFVINYTDKPVSHPWDGMGIWYYLLMLSILPVSLYLLKNKNPYITKYFYFFSFTFFDIVNNLTLYLGTDLKYRSGNIVELFFILFSPIFINKKYFWIVFCGMVFKYGLFGILLKDSGVLVGIIMFSIISIVSFILLNRFSSYVGAIRSVHEELRQNEKLSVIGKMATAIGHEIRNPLASLRGFTQIQQEKYPNQNEFYPIMIQEIDRINAIVSDLMVIGKPRSLTMQQSNMKDLINYVISITSQQAFSQRVSFKINLFENIPYIICEDKQIKQVLINIIKNAIEAMPEGGEVEISSFLNEKNEVIISVKDRGCGISQECVEKLGEPFFTTKPNGNGLGFMVSQHIIQDHDGRLEIESEVGKGTEIKIILPFNTTS